MVRLMGAASIHDRSSLLADIVDSLQTGLVYFGDGDGEIAVNGFARNLLDLPSGDLTLKRVRDRLAALGASPKALGEGSPTSSASCEFMAEQRRYAVSSREMDGGSGRGLLWRIEDVTDARTLQAKLVEARRTAFLAQFAGGAWHEFNNLLARVICLAEEIQQDCETPQVHDRAETLIVTAERGAEVVRRMMRHAAAPMADLQAVNLGQHLEAWRAGAAADGLEIDLDGSAPVAIADPLLLEACLDELLKNAKQAGATRIVIVCQGEAGDFPVSLAFGDNGTGMEDSIASRAVTPFFTTHAESLGLGLSLVQGAVIQWGGKLVLVSQPGKGTTAKLFLPALGPLVGADA